MARTAAVCLPHDWLSWRLHGTRGLDSLTTDRSDASGTGYFDSSRDAWCTDLLQLAAGRSDLALPTVLAPEGCLVAADGTVVSAGAGDNAAAKLAFGDHGTVVSLGTSGVVSATSTSPSADATGTVAGFADATGSWLPLVCTLNVARVLDRVGALLGVDHDGLDVLALSAPPGAEGLLMLPYLDGERTPNLPRATGAFHGLTTDNLTPANLARAAMEGLLCGLAVGLAALREVGVDTSSVVLVGGAAASRAARVIAPRILGVPVFVPPPGDYAADGAARQAAWALAGTDSPPTWQPHQMLRFDADPDTFLVERHREATTLHLDR